MKGFFECGAAVWIRGDVLASRLERILPHLNVNSCSWSGEKPKLLKHPLIINPRFDLLILQKVQQSLRLTRSIKRGKADPRTGGFGVGSSRIHF